MLKTILSCALICTVFNFLLIVVSYIFSVYYKLRTGCSWKTAFKKFDVY